MIFIVARAMVFGRMKTVLINKEIMESDDNKPGDYFIPSATELEVMGEVTIEGDTDDLIDYAYESQ